MWFQIIALILSTTLIWKIMYSPFAFAFRIALVFWIVVAMQLFVLQ